MKTNNQKNKKADQILTNLNEHAKKYQTNPAEKSITEIIKKCKKEILGSKI